MSFCYITLNPTTGKLVKKYPSLAWSSVEQKGKEASRAFKEWREVPLQEKLPLFSRLKDLLLERKGELGQIALAPLITKEMGKPITQAEYEIEKCARGIDYYLENAEKLLTPLPVESDASESAVRYDPLGTLLGIMPWNFPFWQVIRFAVPALLAGNVVFLKHAPHVPGCALALEKLFRDAGFPQGTFQSLFISNNVAKRLILSPWVQGVSLTGSDRAGSAVAEAAGRALKKVVLELGGSDPFIVLADADVEKGAAVALQSRMLNTGQSCIAAKRLIVARPAADSFLHHLMTGIQKLKVGDPMDRTTDIGPLAREDLRRNLLRQVAASVRKGAKLLCGGKALKREGFFFEPSLLMGKPGLPVTTEETFGPVVVVLVVKDEKEAVSLANRTSYGLGASLWTRDLTLAKRLIPQIEAGSVFVNGMVKSDPRLPFGGIKRSGYGRELSSFGIHEFTNIKTVWLA